MVTHRVSAHPGAAEFRTPWQGHTRSLLLFSQRFHLLYGANIHAKEKSKQTRVLA